MATDSEELITVTLPDEVWKLVQLQISKGISEYREKDTFRAESNDFALRADLLQFAQNSIDEAACEVVAPAVVIVDSFADCAG